MRKIGVIIGITLTLAACGPLVVGAGGMTAGVVGLGKRTPGQVVDDTSLWTQIKNSYVQSDINKLLLNVGVEVNQGRVLLTGTVDDPQTRVEAVKLAWQPLGVKEVINEIRIDGAQNIKSYAKDAWITATVKSRLLLERNVESVNYNVDTVGGIVYLIGIAKSEEELKIALQIARNVDGVQKVVSHMYVYEDNSSSGNTINQDTSTDKVESNDLKPLR